MREKWKKYVLPEMYVISRYVISGVDLYKVYAVGLEIFVQFLFSLISFDPIS